MAIYGCRLQLSSHILSFKDKLKNLCYLKTLVFKEAYFFKRVVFIFQLYCGDIKMGGLMIFKKAWVLNITFICTTWFVLPDAQITFELMDSEINEVIFVDETNITFRCSFNGSENTDVTMKIVDPEGNTLTEIYDTVNVEYRKQKVMVEDGGLYTYRVTYK